MFKKSFERFYYKNTLLYKCNSKWYFNDILLRFLRYLKHGQCNNVKLCSHHRHYSFYFRQHGQYHNIHTRYTNSVPSELANFSALAAGQRLKARPQHMNWTEFDYAALPFAIFYVKYPREYTCWGEFCSSAAASVANQYEVGRDAGAHGQSTLRRLVQFSSCAAVNKSSWLLPAQWGARGVRRNIIARTKTPEHLHLTADAHDVVHSISDLYRSFANSTIHVTPRNAVPPSFSPSRPEPSTGAAASVAYKFVYVVCSPVITQKNYLKFSQIILKLTILFIATIQDQQTIYIFFE